MVQEGQALQRGLWGQEALAAQWVHSGPLLLCQLGQEDLGFLDLLCVQGSLGSLVVQ